MFGLSPGEFIALLGLMMTVVAFAFARFGDRSKVATTLQRVADMVDSTNSNVRDMRDEMRDMRAEQREMRSEQGRYGQRLAGLEARVESLENDRTRVCGTK